LAAKELAKPTVKKKKFLKMPDRTTERKMRVSKTGQEQFGRKRSTGYNFVLLPAGVTAEDCKRRTINKISNG
jgi:hypothetical protein